ncbi:MAG TPA: sigma-70 family RNA polymerase sigma factor [Gemmataceae bacterium]|nr:sigma-70 family RNA polymerase sigma factor [Gemmataceae bacterium]
MRRGSSTLDASETGGRDRAQAGGGALSEEFVGWVAASQRPLYAYIRSLVGPWAEPEDILQEVNLVLCRQAHEFDGRGRFLTWACRIAYFQVLAYLKRRQRDKHQYFDEAILTDLAGPLAEQVEQLDSRVEALRHCLGELSPRHRRMITTRYARGGSVQAVAHEVGRPAGSVRVTLHRIRQLLLACIERTLAKGNS